MNDTYSRFKLIIKQLILNGKYSFSSIEKIILITSIVFFAILLPIIFVPLRFSIGIVVFIGSVIPASVIFISTNFNFRRSTLYSNQSTTKSSRINFYISSMILYFITIYLLTMIIFFVLVIAQELNILLYDWAKYKDDAYALLKINYGAFIYSIFELGLVMFGILFICQEMVKSEKTIYFIILSTLILAIIYGGVFNNYFSKARGRNDAELGLIRFPFYNSSSMLGYLFYPSAIILPFFGPMQHLSYLKWGMCVEYDYFNVPFFAWQLKGWYVYNGFSASESIGLAFHWNILWFMPYIHVALFGASGIIISHLKR